MPFFDLEMAYDPVSRSCDLVIGDDGDLAIDVTPVTPMLISIGSDARAETDDPLPDGETWLNAYAGENKRRGWAGDALDPAGNRRGSKLWLLNRAKETEGTRLFVEDALRDCLDWAETETGFPAGVSAFWLPSTRATGARLAYTAFVRDEPLSGEIRLALPLEAA